LPTGLQNFTQKDLTEVKIFQKVLGGGLLSLKHPVDSLMRGGAYGKLHGSRSQLAVVRTAAVTDR